MIFVFGARRALRGGGLAQLRRKLPDTPLFGCSTAGEVHGDQVADDSVVATFVKFSNTRAVIHRVPVNGQSFDAGLALGAAIDPRDLAHLLVLSDGLHVNGTELVRGLAGRIPKKVVITGGLSADGEAFEETLVVARGSLSTGTVAALALYGDRLEIGCGSLGGWDQFGLERRITKSAGNVLYELDGKSALALYKTYLGEHASQLPASGLLFPLGIRAGEDAPIVVRTILAVDEERQSLTFAGDVPEGQYARLMRANFDRLIDGAVGAARISQAELGSRRAELALLISCVGRRLILKQRVEEEIEGVREVLGPDPCLMGFYSYGEISPFSAGGSCELHNQTMTITTFREN